MNWTPSSWVQMKGLQRGVGQRISKEKRRFAKAKPLTPEQARDLVQLHVEFYGVKHGPSPQERREMWGMG